MLLTKMDHESNLSRHLLMCTYRYAYQSESRISISHSKFQPPMPQKTARSNRHNNRSYGCRLFSRLFLGSQPPSPPSVTIHHRISSPPPPLSPPFLPPCTRETRSFALALPPPSTTHTGGRAYGERSQPSGRATTVTREISGSARFISSRWKTRLASPASPWRGRGRTTTSSAPPSPSPSPPLFSYRRRPRRPPRRATCW